SLRMDISVLPNNNHPEKFLQLDVGMLPRQSSRLQWNSLQSPILNKAHQFSTEVARRACFDFVFVFSLFVCKCNCFFAMQTLSLPTSPLSNIKRNPLYMDIKSMDAENNEKSKPSWTVKEYDTQTIHGNLADYLKKTPKDLEFWIEDLYTPGFDSLLKRKEAEHKRKRLKILSLVVLSVCSFLILIIVPVVVLQKKD
uniref:Membrane integral NOTCH2 associated receptor 2 n=1 Tax=Amphiprion percula TaxID=161767 RepID=A0A3P8T7E6_AMPPE